MISSEKKSITHELSDTPKKYIFFHPQKIQKYFHIKNGEKTLNFHNICYILIIYNLKNK